MGAADRGSGSRSIRIAAAAAALSLLAAHAAVGGERGDDRPERPPWAEAAGQDDHGWWADAAIAGVRQRFRRIPAGALVLSAPDDDPAAPPARPPTRVAAFWLADSECTQRLWTAVLGDAPQAFADPALPERPVERVSWDDAQRFCVAVRTLVPALAVRLPTDAEWEHAARAGGPAAVSDADLERLAWYGGNSDGETHPVRARPPNRWGVHDLFGNVREWCQDAYTAAEAADASAEPLRSYRGGGWLDVPSYCGVLYRNGVEAGTRYKDLGFRVVAEAATTDGRSAPPRP